MKNKNASEHSEFDRYLNSERQQREEKISIKKMYIDLCDGDFFAGLLLSQILYWFSNGKSGEKRVKIMHHDRWCLIKRRNDWWDECRISEKQYDRAMGFLKEKGYFTTETHKCHFFNGQTATYIFMDEEKLWKSLKDYHDKEILQKEQEIDSRNSEMVNPELPKGEFQSLPLGNSGITEKVNPSYIQRLYANNITEEKESAGKADAPVSFSGNSLSNYQTSKDQGSFFSNAEDNITYNTGPTNNGHSYNKLEINSSNNKLNITNPKDSQTKSNSPPSQELIERRQNVHTSDFQHQNLVEKHGKELVELSYDDLSLWKSNKTSKELAKATDYGRLTKWVINSVRELQIKEKELKQREERLKGKSYANSKDDIRKSQDDEYFKNNGNPDENPRIRRFKNEIK